MWNCTARSCEQQNKSVGNGIPQRGSVPDALAIPAHASQPPLHLRDLVAVGDGGSLGAFPVSYTHLTKVAKAEVAFDDICAIDMEGKVIHTSNGRKPTGEWPFHLRIMQKRPDVKGIIHALSLIHI